MSKLVNRIAAVAALALAATPIIGLTAAHAAPQPSPSTVVARAAFGDLTLSRPDDAREFQRRVDKAAEDACVARKVRGLSYRACLIDIRSDLINGLPTAQRAALLNSGRASAKTVAER